MTAPLLVFDLDGTLIDTAPDLVDTLNVVFAREGLPPVPYETARNFIGGGARAMIARGIEAENRVFPPDKLEQMFADFLAHYADHVADRSRPFPGLIDALDELAAGGHRFAVCTNKLERLSLLCSIRSRSATASKRSADKTHSESRSRIRRCCGGRSRRPVARRNARS